MLLKESSAPMVKTLATFRASVGEATALTCSRFLIQNEGEIPAPLLTSIIKLGVFHNFRDSQDPPNNLLWTDYGTSHVTPGLGRVLLHILCARHATLPAVL